MSDRARRVLRLIALLLLLIVVGIRLMPHARRNTNWASSPVAHKPSPPPELRLGTLTLTPCEIGRQGVGGVGTTEAFCTAFDVPEDWGAPQGRHIQLRVAIVKSSAPRPPSDLVTFLDGGPGGAATEDYPAIAPAFAPLREKRDILLVDQRGTGASNPLRCESEKNSDTAAVKDIADRIQLVQQCLDKVRGFAAPERYTTTDAARDLEHVRQALGSPLLNLIGGSYGTRMAQQYAGHYPGSVRSVVLDSTVPNELALGSEHARNLEAALHAEFALCTKATRCQQNFGDTYQTLYRLRDHLRGHPEEVALRDPNNFEPTRLRMSADDLAAIVRFYAYSPVTAALLPLMLNEADHGNYEPLLSQKKMLTDSLGTEIDSGMELSVICTEDADLLAARAEDATTLMGNTTVDRIKSACSVWPRGERPAAFHRPFTSALPVLILEGQYDPVTPPAYGAQQLKTLSHARMLVAPGQGHIVIIAGCMPKLVGEFIDELQPAKIDASCLKQLGDTPAFVDFNGAQP
jgi:pimeloyl-ACP methyl ester carboxylesterase